MFVDNAKLGGVTGTLEGRAAIHRHVNMIGNLQRCWTRSLAKGNALALGAGGWEVNSPMSKYRLGQPAKRQFCKKIT